MRILKEGGVPFYANPTAAAKALGALARTGASGGATSANRNRRPA